MARLPKFPKQPKMSSSLATWERYEARVKAVAAKRKAIQDAPKKKEALKSRISKIKNR